MTNTDHVIAPDASLVEAVRDRIAAMLAGGEFPPGTRLPPERALAERFAVNRLTVNKALGRFVDAGQLSRKVGSGTWVLSAPPAKGLALVDVLLPHNERIGEGASAMLGRPGVTEGVHDYFRDRTVRMAIAYYRTPEELAQRIRRLAEEPTAAQIIWHRPDPAVRTALQELKARRRAFCLIDNRDPGEDTHVVASDNFQGGLAAAEALVTAGRSRLTYLGLPSHEESLAERLQGLRSGAVRGRATLDERVVRDRDEAVREIGRMLDAGQSDGLACSNDWIAIAALAELKRRGVTVPRDLSVIGYDDIEDGRFAEPALSTVAQDFAAIGYRAAEVVDRAWHTPSPSFRAQFISPRLVRRASI